jgi:hypothetical protein
MKLFGRELVGYAKTLVVLIAIFLVSSGLCALQWNVSMGGGSMGAGGNAGAVLIPLGIVELLAMLVSAVGIVLVLLAWGARALFSKSPTELKLGVQDAPTDESPTQHDGKQ